MGRSAGLIVLFGSAVLYWLGFSMLRPMVALFFNDAGYSLASVGGLMALHAIVPVLFAMPAGQIIDRIGPRRSVAYGSGVMVFSGLCYVLGGATEALLPTLVGQLCNGVGSLLCWGAMQASVGQMAKDGPNASRGNRLLANFAFANAVAQFGGPVLGGAFADLGDYTSVFLVFTGLSAACIGCARFLPSLDKKDGAVADVSFGFWKSYGSGIELMRRNRPFSVAMLCNGVLFVLVDVKGTFLPIYLANLEYTNTQIGVMLSFGGVASIVVRPFVGALIDRLGHPRIMSGSLWLGSLCLIALVFEPSYWGILAIVFAWGVCAGVNQPVALIMVANTVTADRQGMGMSLRTMVNRVVQVVNPVAIGGVSAVIGLTYSFGLIAAALIGFSFVMKRSMAERDRPAA